MFTTGQTTLDQHTMYTLFENCTFADAEFTMFSMNGEKNILHACLFQQIGPLGNALNLDGTSNQIKQCTFINNTIAINVFNTNNTITHNNFINNTDAAVIASPIWLGENDAIIVNDNWWGNKTGPSHPTVNPEGSGDNISGNIECSTWLNQTIPYQPLKNRPRYIPSNQDDIPPNQNDDDQKQTSNGMNYTLFLPLIIGILAIIAILIKKR